MEEEELAQMKSSLRNIELAVCGDNRLGIPGLAEDMKRTKARLDALEENQTTIKGGWMVIVAVVAGLAWFWSQIREFFLR